MTLIDVSIAFLAELLIIPAMYVAQAQGVAIISNIEVMLGLVVSIASQYGHVYSLVGFGLAMKY